FLFFSFPGWLLCFSICSAGLCTNCLLFLDHCAHPHCSCLIGSCFIFKISDLWTLQVQKLPDSQSLASCPSPGWFLSDYLGPHHHYSKAERHPVTALEKMMESSFAGPQSFPEVPSPDRGSQSIKHHRTLSSCCSPGQRSGMLHRNAFRRTPPSPRSRLGGLVGPAYQQLEESRIPDQDTIPCQGIEVRKTISHLPLQLWCVERSLDLKYSANGLTTQQNASINMQLPSRETNSYFNSLEQKDLMGYSSPRASSVPIIPSVGLEETCMQMPGISEVKSIKWCKNSYSADIVNVSIPVSDCLIAEQQEVKILLETVQEQIRILTDARRSEDYELASVETEDSASENTAFLPLSPTAKSEREAQFVLRNEIQRDPALTK
ncbi:hypothetical protein FD754_016326, partial [Muntiacus muntjak]